MKKYLTIVAVLLVTLFCVHSTLAATMGTSNASNLNKGLTAYYTMDGSSINWSTGTMLDRSGNGNTGQFAGMSTTTSPTIGKVGQALKFTGNLDNYIQVPNPALSGGFTYSTWVKSAAYSSDVFTNDQFFMRAQPPGENATQPWECFVWLSDGSVEPRANSGVGSTDHLWHHVVCTWDGTYLKIYVDGLYRSQSTRAGTLRGVTNGASIGPSLNGADDDVRFYNRPLSAAEVAQLYAQGGGKIGQSNTTAVSKGLVGYWPLDGATTNWVSNTTGDASGNGNTASLVGMSTTTSPTVGVIGQALKFNGANQYVAPAVNQPLANEAVALTVGAWFKTTGGGVIVSDSNTPPEGGVTSYDPLLYIQTNGLLHAGGWIGTSATITSPSALNDGKWHHAILTYNGVDTQSLYVDGIFVGSVTGTKTGVGGTNYWAIGTGETSGWPNGNGGWYYLSGSIDDVRIYNRRLSASEISQLYKVGAANVDHSNTVTLSAGLAGYWTFDGSKTNWSTGTTGDSSGNGNNGSLVNMSTTTSPTIGKIGQALNFNGTSQIVNMGNVLDMTGTQSFSYGTWAKYTSEASQNYPGIISKNPAGAATGAYHLLIDTSNNPYCEVDISSTGYLVNPNTAKNDNRWHHFVCVVNESALTLTMYIDGVSVGSTAIPAGSESNSGPLTIGGRSDGSGVGANRFAGSIDDARIYTRALSATEVKQLYTMGK